MMLRASRTRRPLRVCRASAETAELTEHAGLEEPIDVSSRQPPSSMALGRASTRRCLVSRPAPSGEERGAPRRLSERGTLFDAARSHSGVSRRPTSTRAPLGRRPRPYPLDGLSHHPPLLSHTTASRVEFSHLSIGLDDSGRAEQRGEEPIEEHADGRPMTGAITSAADRGPAPPLPPAPLSPPRPVPGVPSSAPGRRSGSSRPEGPR